ncbi:thiol reductant ABC exporter subunit CydD [Rhizobium sp. S95]|uniref:Thiol reductant ABC exporter subunit CydD n=1 Tax=Ciceribacter sichuanensis TaxID=2949647 RepID=A0AAJ1BYJ6_9HYPH|nr:MULTISPECIES: thiol reductant ABC exporter subunit CydD [unclassified Ciceribacter]MCM2394663.1 thiol reductant ABC exporter subunit CydD [Ciceribacter sp. S95]MCO5958630.1 thiol reductant ABC exporter subunit CydD [Ciceribacter sp. S101]
MPNVSRKTGRSRSGAKGALAGPGRVAVALAVIAPLCWLPQAGFAAHAIGRMADGAGVSGVVYDAIGFILFGLLRAALDALSGRLAFTSARRELTTSRVSALAALAARSPVDIGRPSSGQAASVIAEQAEMITPWLSRYVPARMKAVVVPLVIVATILPFSWIAALALLLTAPVIPLFMALVGMGAQKASEKQLSRMGDINAFLIDRLRGLATIRTLGAVSDTAKRLRVEADDLKRRTMAVLKIAFLTSATLELFSALGVALTAVYVGFHLLSFIGFGAWGGKLTLSEGLFVLMVAPAFFEPLRELSAVWHDRAAGEAAHKALTALAEQGMPLPKSCDTSDDASFSRQSEAALLAENLRYTHPGREAPTLEAFSLSVAPGEKIAIMAPSGAGKSTLLSLIAGLAAPEAGSLLLSGHSPAAAREACEIAWIGQSAHVFSGSIATNVSLGRDEVDAGAVASALAVSRLSHVAESHGRAPLGEGGTGLSGGEIVRLAIARAAASTKARLILADEPTAHLDAVTADLVTDSLLDLAKGRTLVVVTHDVVLAARMDRIVALAAEEGA